MKEWIARIILGIDADYIRFEGYQEGYRAGFAAGETFGESSGSVQASVDGFERGQKAALEVMKPFFPKRPF